MGLRRSCSQTPAPGAATEGSSCPFQVVRLVKSREPVEFKVETVERYRRVGDTIEGEITFYDSTVYVTPVHSKLFYELETDTRPELRPLYNSCTDTNGPASKVHMDERGFLNERFLEEFDPFLETVRPDPRFRELMDEVRRRRESLAGVVGS